jgi:hypothetical protein
MEGSHRARGLNNFGLLLEFTKKISIFMAEFLFLDNDLWIRAMLLIASRIDLISRGP